MILGHSLYFFKSFALFLLSILWFRMNTEHFFFKQYAKRFNDLISEL